MLVTRAPPADKIRGTRAPPAPVEWRISGGLVPYDFAVAEMEARAAGIRAGTAPELVWLLEHPPLYTAGTSAREEDLRDPARFPVHRAGRGGRYTYHGPGQRVAYAHLDLKRRGEDVRAYVRALEDWIIAALDRFALKGERRPDRVGVWIDKGGGGAEKIAAIGVRVRRWVTFHGVSLNVDPDLSHYDGIVPCGIAEYGVTSLVREGIIASMPEVDAVLKECFGRIFGR